MQDSSQLDLFSDQDIPVDERKTYLMFPRYRTAILKQGDWHSQVSSFIVKSQHDFTTAIDDIPTELIAPSVLLHKGFTILTPEPTRYAFNNPTIRKGYYSKDLNRWIPYQNYKANTPTKTNILSDMDIAL